MLSENISTLVGQCNAFHETYMSTIGDDEEAVRHLGNFLVDFITGANAFRLVTQESLSTVAVSFISRDVLENFVLSLRFVALAPLSPSDLEEIILSFAAANANEPINDKNNLSVLPNDAANWRVNGIALANLYRANLWLIPLLAFGFLFKENQERGLG